MLLACSLLTLPQTDNQAAPKIQLDRLCFSSCASEDVLEHMVAVSPAAWAEAFSTGWLHRLSFSAGYTGTCVATPKPHQQSGSV